MMKKSLWIALVCFLPVGAWAQTWDFVSTFDDYVKEGWFIFRAPRAGTEVTQNTDGTVTVSRLGEVSDTIYLMHDVQWVEPEDISNVKTWSFTYEVRIRADRIGGPNSGDPDEHGDRVSFYP
ncbi:MAG TPA: hypothetical protein PK360_20840, partial [bacterium]|nr:hypothetical protein [bacterium]